MKQVRSNNFELLTIHIVDDEKCAENSD